MLIENIRALNKRIGIEPYWYLIVSLLLGAAALFANHLLTGQTPRREIFTIPAPLNFDIFWYSICIVGGVLLGSYVVSRLALERGERLFRKSVPAHVRRKPLAFLSLPAGISEILAKGGYDSFGSLLLQWGFDPRQLGLNRQGLETLQTCLENAPGVSKQWLENAPWRPWNPDHVWNGIVWALILGVIGARLYHVLTPSPSMAAVGGIESPLDYFRNPSQLVNLRSGGLGIYGGMIGGTLGLFWYTRRQRLPAIAWADLAAIGFALGQVFGRWGNFFNQELYGRPTDLPWGISIDAAYLLPGYEQSTRFHPAFLYESLWSLLTFIVLLTLLRRRSRQLLTGDLAALFLIFYALGRILLETIRLDSRTITLGGTSIQMAVATLVSIIIAILMVIWRASPRLRGRG